LERKANKNLTSSWLKIIAEGQGKMPAQKSLNKEEQKQALGYVRSLAK